MGNLKKTIYPPEHYWDQISVEKPYLRYYTDLKGNTMPQILIVQKRIDHKHSEIYKDRLNRYNSFVRELDISDGKKPLRVLSDLNGLYAIIKDQLNRQIEQLETIDRSIISWLRVRFFECCQLLKPFKENRADYKELISNFFQLCHNRVKVLCFTDNLVNEWIPQRFNKDYVPEGTRNLIIEIIQTDCSKKERIIEQMVPVYEKLIHLETLKYYALNNIPLITDNEQDMPGTVSTDDIRAYDAEYWNTAFELHKVNTWEKVYEIMEAKRKELRLTVKYSSFDSFSTSQKRESKKRNNVP